ncbi:MAG TPA: SCO family protein [Devosia sp.]
MTDAVSPGLRRFRMILWGLVIVAAVGATLLFVFRPPQKPLGVTGQPFTLESTAGGTFTQENLKGTPSLVFFGYTFCPDVCPTTLAESVAWKQQAGLTDADLRTIFVTVDPERDTKEVLKEYLGGFDPDVIGLVGTPEQTEAAKASFGVMSEKDTSGDAEYYLVNHTATVFLIDRNGQFQGTIAYGEDAKTAVQKIEKLVKG